MKRRTTTIPTICLSICGIFSITIYVANLGSGTVSVIYGGNDTVEKKQIEVRSPRFIVGPGMMCLIGGCANLIYVDSSDSILMIDGDTDTPEKTRIPLADCIYAPHYPMYMTTDARVFPPTIYVGGYCENIKAISLIPFPPRITNQIPVRIDLRSMLVSHYGNGTFLYVATGPFFDPWIAGRDNGTVSAINQYAQNITEQIITVGPGPNEMVDGLLSKIYVSNRAYTGYHGSNNQTISVIDVSGRYGIPDKKETHDIIVGQNPGPMALNSKTHLIYVGNTGSGTVSVINGFTSKVAAGVRFKINPANSGTIMCNNQSDTKQIEYPTNIYIYVDNGTKCIGQGNTNFVFDRWVQDLGLNSSLPVDAPSGYLTVDRYGNFTANFIPSPPLLPPAYLFLIITVLVTSIIGWSWNSIVA